MKFLNFLKENSLYCLCLIFILGGAVNYGFSSFWMAIPFMFIAYFNIKDIKIKGFTLLFSLGAVLFNLTLQYNPLIFPVLYNGQVSFLYDGYIEIFNDHSGGFRNSTNLGEDNGCINCGKTQRILIKKGQIAKVTGITISHPDFGTNINLETELGPISQYDYNGSKVGLQDTVSVNKPVVSPIASNLSFLMAYPVLFFSPIGIFVSLLFIFVIGLFRYFRK